MKERLRHRPRLTGFLVGALRRRTIMRREKFAIANIYVPVKRRATLKPETVQQVPILVRPDGDRFVLIHGLHRLEACKALGEETIYGYLTQAPKH